MSSVVHARVGPRRGARARTWWGKAWVRAIEESAYGDTELAAGRALSRAGRVGGITVRLGGLVAAVEDGEELWPVAVTVPALAPTALEALVEVVAAESGRVPALLAGDLPHALVEHAEEAGVELLPFGGELGSECGCAAWVAPCGHAIAVLDQVTALLDADPLVLLHLRGLPREELLARLHERAAPAGRSARSPARSQGQAQDPGPSPSDAEPGTVPDDDLDTALEAALRAATALRLLGTDEPVDHLF